MSKKVLIIKAPAVKRRSAIAVAAMSRRVSAFTDEKKAQSRKACRGKH